MVKAKNSLPAKAPAPETRLGQKFGVLGGDDPLSYILAPPAKPAARSAEVEEDIMTILQRFYDLVEAEPGLTRDLKDKIARLLAKFHRQEEPGFTADEAYKLIIRDYQMVRDIPERPPSKSKTGNARKSQGKVRMKQQAAPLGPDSPRPSGGKVPTMAEIIAGRPIGPGDFGPSAGPQDRRRSPRGNLPAGMPGPMPGPGRRRMGFQMMGFPMFPFGPGGFYGRPW